jgi:hypothetical protein
MFKKHFANFFVAKRVEKYYLKTKAKRNLYEDFRENSKKKAITFEQYSGRDLVDMLEKLEII